MSGKRDRLYTYQHVITLHECSMPLLYNAQMMNVSELGRVLGGGVRIMASSAHEMKALENERLQAPCFGVLHRASPGRTSRPAYACSEWDGVTIWTLRLPKKGKMTKMSVEETVSYRGKEQLNWNMYVAEIRSCAEPCLGGSTDSI